MNFVAKALAALLITAPCVRAQGIMDGVTIFDHATTYERFGSTTYGSDGSIYYHSGGMTYGSDGSAFQTETRTLDPLWHRSPDVTWGDKTYTSDEDGNEMVCHHEGYRSVCN